MGRKTFSGNFITKESEQCKNGVMFLAQITKKIFMLLQLLQMHFSIYLKTICAHGIFQ